MRSKLRDLALTTGAILLTGALTACNGVRLDMHVQPKLKPLRQSDFFADDRGSRPLPAGTVARGELREDAYFYTGMVNGTPGDAMPFPVTKEVLERGRQRFNIYCSPCHSYVGNGNGMIVQRGYQRPPSYTEPRLLNAPLGHFYDVITHGYGRMADYGAQVAPADRWNIAAYIRALQLSQHAPATAVPAGTQMQGSVVIENNPGEKRSNTERK
ncbi:MAG: c-type cytochrome [Terriglobales bacterium]